MSTTKMVQIRDVSATTVDTLKGRAASRGMSLSEFLKAELEAIAARPEMDEVLARMAARPRRRLGVDVVQLVRETRGEYEHR